MPVGTLITKLTRQCSQQLFLAETGSMPDGYMYVKKYEDLTTVLVQLYVNDLMVTGSIALMICKTMKLLMTGEPRDCCHRATAP